MATPLISSLIQIVSIAFFNLRSLPERKGAAYLLFDGYRASTINWHTFSQVTFAFRVSPVLLDQAVLFATGIGPLGGLFPAIRVARLPIAAGLSKS